MTQTKIKTHEKEVEVIEDDSPAVVAYRVRQLEKTQEAGFKSLNDKLDEYISGFVTKTAFEEAKKQADDEHQDMRKDIDKILEWKDKIISRIALGAVVGLVMMVLALYGLEKFFKF